MNTNIANYIFSQLKTEFAQKNDREKIPPIKNTASRFNCSTATIKKVYEHLIRENSIIYHKGNGYFSISPKPIVIHIRVENQVLYKVIENIILMYKHTHPSVPLKSEVTSPKTDGIILFITDNAQFMNSENFDIVSVDADQLTDDLLKNDAFLISRFSNNFDLLTDTSQSCKPINFTYCQMFKPKGITDQRINKFFEYFLSDSIQGYMKLKKTGFPVRKSILLDPDWNYDEIPTLRYTRIAKQLFSKGKTYE